MRFNAKKEEELSTALLKKGEYNFKVIDAKERISNSGNEMIVLTLKIENRILTDYLLEAFDFKIRHFAYGAGLQKAYENGELTADDCINKTGLCIVGEQPEKYDANSGKTYSAKNVVSDYCVGEVEAYVENRKEAFQEKGQGVGQSRGAVPPNSDLPFNDDIPF